MLITVEVSMDLLVVVTRGSIAREYCVHLGKGEKAAIPKPMRNTA